MRFSRGISIGTFVLANFNTDYEGCRIVLSFPEQHPPPLSALPKGPQQESPVRAIFPYLSFTYSFIFSESVIVYVY